MIVVFGLPTLEIGRIRMDLGFTPLHRPLPSWLLSGLTMNSRLCTTL